MDAARAAPRRARRWRCAAAAAALLACGRGAHAQFLRGGFGGSGGDAGGVIQDEPLPAGWCKSTMQGRQYVADDGGRVCEWAGTDSKGCCATPLDACAGCDTESKCCPEFEFCVSCCQRSAAVLAGAWRNVPRIPGHSETGTWADAFDYCTGKCRTNPKSTVHENEYVSHSHHCFGDAAFAGAGAPPPLAPLPEGVSAVAAEEGASCTVTCAAAGLSCMPSAFAALNSCERLRAAFPCEAGCQPAAGPELPAYNSGAVADASTFCRTDNGSSGARTCDASAANTRRLCPCGTAPAG